jgi:hypothetical protein
MASVDKVPTFYYFLFLPHKLKNKNKIIKYPKRAIQSLQRIVRTSCIKGYVDRAKSNKKSSDGLRYISPQIRDSNVTMCIHVNSNAEVRVLSCR